MIDSTQGSSHVVLADEEAAPPERGLVCAVVWRADAPARFDQAAACFSPGSSRTTTEMRAALAAADELDSGKLRQQCGALQRRRN
jgi:hypothetical protein